MKILAFDTETTGKENNQDKTKPSARVVQIAAKLIELESIPDEYPFKVTNHAVFKTLIDTGVPVPDATAAFHGITTEKCEKFGVPHDDALFFFASLIRQADAFLGHNLGYDIRVLRHAYYLEQFEGEPFEGKPIFDTMKSNTNVCKVPPKRPQRHANDWKWPTLQEAYAFFYHWEMNQIEEMSKEEADEIVKDKFVNAHDAMFDTDACIEVFLSSCRYTGLNPFGALNA